MNILEALQYPFADKQWKNKLGIATLLMVIPVVGWLALLGYGIRITRRVANDDRRLPDWQDFGRDANTGIMVAFGGSVYAAPVVVFLCMIIFLSGLGGDEVTLILSCCLGSMLLVYGIVITPLSQAAVAQYAHHNDVTEFFNVPARIQDATAHSDQAVNLAAQSAGLGILMAIPLGLGAFTLTLLFAEPLLGLCCFLVFLLPALALMAYLLMANFYLIGQWGKVIGARRQN